MDRIARLTDYQISTIYFKADKKEEFNGGGSYQELFIDVWHHLRGKPISWVKARWKTQFPDKPWEEIEDGAERQ